MTPRAARRRMLLEVLDSVLEAELADVTLALGGRELRLVALRYLALLQITRRDATERERLGVAGLERERVVAVPLGLAVLAVLGGLPGISQELVVRLLGLVVAASVVSTAALLFGAA